jgi:hypothetical protein
MMRHTASLITMVCRSIRLPDHIDTNLSHSGEPQVRRLVVPGGGRVCGGSEMFCGRIF